LSNKICQQITDPVSKTVWTAGKDETLQWVILEAKDEGYNEKAPEVKEVDIGRI
jgi:hypothetical protein